MRSIYWIPDEESVQGRRQAVSLILHCGGESGRDAYIDELQKYIPVDRYGACGTGAWNCSRNTNCYIKLAPKYKFWLSFENS